MELRAVDRYVVELEVSDNGIGIKEEEIKQLFQDFYKVTDSENVCHNPKGVGLGLAISQELALLMGPPNSGGIMVKSKFGEGTQFLFRLLNQGLAFEENLEESKQEDYLLSNNSYLIQQANVQPKFLFT